MSRLLTLPCTSVRSGPNQLVGSIPSELGELTSLTGLWVGTWIGLSFLHEWHAYPHWPCHSVPSANSKLTGSIPSELKELTSLIKLWLRTWIGLLCCHACRACSHFLAILFDKITMIWLVTLIPSFVIDHCCGLNFGLIALLKLCAAAALNVINADGGNFCTCNR
jgi:hypothetical protein